MLEAGIRALLIAAEPIAMLIGSSVYPVALPADATLPAVTFQVVEMSPEYSNDGPVGCVSASVQIAAWSPTYLVVKTITDAIRATLDGYVGTLPDGTAVQNATRNNVTDYFEKDSRLFRTQTDWKITFAEAM